MKYILSIFAIVAMLSCQSAKTNNKNDNTDNMSNMSDEAIVKFIADKLCNLAVLGFEDVKSEKFYASTNEIPEGVEVKFANKYCNWHYTNGVLDMAMMNMGEYFNEAKYTDFARKHIAFGFDNYKYFEKRYNPDIHGKHWKYPFGELYNTLELDDFGAMISSTIDVYITVDKRPEYKEYADAMGDFIMNKKLRHDDGTFVRTFPKINTLWGDDLYMSIPFLVRMSKLTADPKYMDDAIRQTINFDKYLWDEKREIYYHSYFTDTQENGASHWGRCNGWIIFAKIHLLEAMNKNHPQRNLIIKSLNRQIVGLARYQNGQGLWHQILDRNDSYLESSCSAMFTYAVAAAINRGWTDSHYASLAMAGWNGLITHKLTAKGDMKDICEGTEIHSDLMYYYQRPTNLNEKHGLGALLDAGVEIIKLKKAYPGIAEDMQIRISLNKEEE